MPFEYQTICKPDNFWPFEYRTSPVFRWLLYMSIVRVLWKWNSLKSGRGVTYIKQFSPWKSPLSHGSRNSSPISATSDWETGFPPMLKIVAVVHAWRGWSVQLAHRCVRILNTWRRTIYVASFTRISYQWVLDSKTCSEWEHLFHNIRCPCWLLLLPRLKGGADKDFE